MDFCGPEVEGAVQDSWADREAMQREVSITETICRWHNHLDPYIKKDPINKEEERKIFDLHKKLGNKWADIAKELPGRSDNCIKNYFYSTHRKH